MSESYGAADDGAPEPPVTVSRTVSEADVYQFAGITGDLNRVHMDAQFMTTTPFGQRLVHGAYIVGLISAASTRLIERTGRLAVAYGHDRIRYLAPTFIGDTLTVTYRPLSAVGPTGKVVSDVEVRNQRDQLVTVGTHTLFFLDAENNASGGRK
jgi:3-hydroxybutyryl-CoA dehydratase